MIVIPLGVRRSGTSLLAELLHKLGIHMGDRLSSLPVEWNPNGGYEDLEFADAMDDLLKNCTIDNGKIVHCHQPHLDRISQYIAVRSQRPAWGVKNFGLLFCLPTFTSLCGEPVRVVCIRRSFSAMVNSWTAREKCTLRESLLLYSHSLYNLEMCLSKHNGPKMTIQFEDLIDRPRMIIREIAEFSGVPYRDGLENIVQKKLMRFG